MIDEDDYVDLMSFMRPDGSGEKSPDSQQDDPGARSSTFPYDRPVSYGKSQWPSPSIWEQLVEDLEVEIPRDPGMGEGGLGPSELEMDDLRRDFARSFVDASPQTAVMSSRDLFSLLNDMDPDFIAQRFSPEDDDEMRSTYIGWAGHVLGVHPPQETE